MKNNGFLKAGQQTTLSADYVKEQRSSVVKKFQEVVLKLKKSISELGVKKGSIENDLILAFRDRLKLVEIKENSLKDLEKATASSFNDLEKEREKFCKEKKEEVVKHNILIEDLRSETRKNETVLVSIKERENAMSENSQRVDDYGDRLSKEDERLKLLDKSLGEKDANITARDGELKVDINNFHTERDGFQTSLDVLKLSRETNESQIIELNSLVAKASTSKSESEESLQKLKTEKRENDRVYKNNLDMAENFKNQAKELSELRSKLKVWEKYNRGKKSDLGVRESRLLETEKIQGAK